MMLTVKAKNIMLSDVGLNIFRENIKDNSITYRKG